MRVTSFRFSLFLIAVLFTAAGVISPLHNVSSANAADQYNPSTCGNNGKKVLLVFDDYPPSLKKFKALIRTAHRNNIGIGIAPNGKYVKSGRVKPNFARDRGMLVIDHGYEHVKFTTLKYKQIAWQVTRPQIDSNYVRPPYGAYNDTVLKVFKNKGKRNCMWNLDPRDWDGKTPEQAAKFIIKNAKKGSTAVVHMNHLGTKPNLLITIKKGLAKRGIKMCKPWTKPTPHKLPPTYCS